MTNNLKETISSIQKDFTANPKNAVVQYESNSILKEGLQSVVTLREHKLIVDEPKSFGGKDEGPSPVELILAALATCQEITYKAFATASGINIESVSVNLTGTLDLQGFLALNKKTRPGFQHISGSVDIKSSSPKVEIDKLIDTVNTHCPVLDILSKGVPIKLFQKVSSNTSVNTAQTEQRASVA
jgi:putative redox protein